MLAEAALAITVLAGEKGLLHIPSTDEVRMQPITRAGNDAAWPFSVDSGHLTCVWSAGVPVVMFVVVDAEDEDPEPSGVLLSANPLELTIGNIATRGLFAAAANVEERLRAVGPFIDMGRKLCDQPPGELVRSGEL